MSNLSEDKINFIKKANFIFNNKFDYSKVNYINNKTKVEIICPIHGSFETTPHSHLRSKYGCKKCSFEARSKNNAKGKEDFIKDAIKIHLNKYDYSLVDYVNNRTEVNIVCPEHGSFYQLPYVHLRGCGCPICAESHGEKEIKKILNEFEIEYITQYEISIDKSINPSGIAKIDFYLPKFNTFIEYNGKQHYQKCCWTGRTFEKQMERDNAVREYCKNNNIKLIEIKYNESITKILTDHIIERG